MAIADSTPNPSTRCAIAVAAPLREFLLENQIRSSSSPDADAIVRELIAHAGILPDATGDGSRFVLVALPPHLLKALAAHLPPAPQPMPLLEWMA